jgi:hypothetical protein
MKARLFLKEGGKISLLAETNLEVVPRGLYVVDGVPYQYTGQPVFYLVKSPTGSHTMESVDLVVEKA